MSNSKIFTKNGNSYSHYHLIGTGLIISYSRINEEIVVVSKYTGKILKKFEVNILFGFTDEEFIELSKGFYRDLIEEGITFSTLYNGILIDGGVKIDLETLLN